MTHFIINTKTNEIYYEGISLEDCQYNMPKVNIYRDADRTLKPTYTIVSEDMYDILQDKGRRFVSQTPADPDTLQYVVTWRLTDGRELSVPMKLG